MIVLKLALQRMPEAPPAAVTDMKYGYTFTLFGYPINHAVGVRLVAVWQVLRRGFQGWTGDRFGLASRLKAACFRPTYLHCGSQL